MGKWMTKPLGEVTSYIAKGIPPKYAEIEDENTIYVLNQKCNRNFSISYSDARLNNTLLKKVPDEKMLRDGDVLINSTGTGTAGRVAQMDIVERPTTFDAHMIVLRPTAEIEFRYFGYSIKNQQSLIESFAEGSTGQTEINRERLLREVQINYPVDLKEQHEISELFYELDRKIQINTGINNNLEQQAQALFKKMFPKILTENCNTTMESVASFSNGKKRPQEFGNIPVYGGNGILAYTSQANGNNCVIIGRVGAYCGSCYLCLSDCWISDNAIQAKSKLGDSQLFLYYLLKNAELPSRHIGTGQPLLTQGILNAVPIASPDISIVQEFEQLCGSLHKLVENNLLENQRLSLLRDTLLPKLVSGEIDVSDIEL